MAFIARREASPHLHCLDRRIRRLMSQPRYNNCGARIRLVPTLILRLFGLYKDLIPSANMIVKLLIAGGRNAVAYHSHLSESHRRDNLRLFRRGTISILVTCRALDEGANVPESNIAIVARSTSSTRQRIQRLGRVLRPAKGKSMATVYTLFAGDDEKERLAQEADDLQGVAQIIWKRGRVA